MKMIRLILPVKAVDAYLYGGYIFLFLQDGSIAYANFNDLIYTISHDRNRKKDLQLAFLPNQYLRGKGYSFLLNFPEIRDLIVKKQMEVLEDGEIDLDIETVKDLFLKFDGIEDIPLDVSLYAGKLFVASEKGVHRCDLNPDYEYNIYPSKLCRIFDAESIALTAKAGMLAVSAKDEGLFSYSIIGSSHSCISDQPSVKERSVRAEWSAGYSIINYKNKTEFSFLKNRVEKQEKGEVEEMNLPRKYKKDFEHKVIRKLGINHTDMVQMFEKTKLEESQLRYVFNTQSSAFLFLKDGSLQVRNIIDDGNKPHLSSKLRHGNDDLIEILKEEPLAATAIPNGCLVETYDKVQCIKNGDIKVIADEPCYGVRSFLSSNNYKNLATIVLEDRVEIVAFPDLPKPESQSRFTLKRESDIDLLPNMDIPFMTSNIPDNLKDAINNNDLPF